MSTLFKGESRECFIEANIDNRSKIVIISIELAKKNVPLTNTLAYFGQTLVTEGKKFYNVDNQMNDEKTAADYKVQGGSVLHLVLALRGGF
jgi:hypothetical protein